MTEEENELNEWVDKAAATTLESLRRREAAGPIKQKDPTYPKKRATEWAVELLYDCGYHFQIPPPPHLVELIAHLFDVPMQPLRKRQPDAFDKATIYLAEHPGASNRQIGKAVGRSKDTIKKWREEKRFNAYVKLIRQQRGLATD